MRRMLAILILVVTTSLWAQQSKNPASDVLRTMLAGREKNTIAAFEEMPADKFNYKPTPEQMTFGHLAAHIIESNYAFCSAVGAVPNPNTQQFEGAEGKDKLIAAMKASFEFCHTALEKAEDSKMGDEVPIFESKPRPRAWAFMGLASSWADHYGMAAIYLRLNGLVPPTAKAKPQK